MPQQIMSPASVLVTPSPDDHPASQYRKSLEQKQEEKVVKSRVEVRIVAKQRKLGKTPKTAQFPAHQLAPYYLQYLARKLHSANPKTFLNSCFRTFYLP